MKFHTYDDNGIFAIVNTATYKTFVDEDWTLDQLFAHFIDSMNEDSLIVWQTSSNGGGEWIFEVLNSPSERPAFREFSKTIRVTNSELFFVSYTDVTMAAQFSDEVLPMKYSEDLRIPLDNGSYELTVRQMFDPRNYDELPQVSFEFVINKATSLSHKTAHKVFWWEE